MEYIIFIPLFLIFIFLLFAIGFVYLFFETITVMVSYILLGVLLILSLFGIVYLVFSIKRFRNITDILRRLIFTVLIIFAPLYFIIVTAVSEQYLAAFSYITIYYQSYKGLFYALIYSIILLAILIIIEIFGEVFNKDKKRHSIEFLILFAGLFFSFIYCYEIQNYYYNKRLDDIAVSNETKNLQEITIKKDTMLYLDMNHKYEKVWASKWLLPSCYQAKEGEIYFTTGERLERNDQTYVAVYNKSISKWGFVPEEVLDY